MANRFYSPFPQFLTADPAVREGYRLFFYAAQSATKQDTFSNAALSVANSNPITLNSLGQPDDAVFLSDLPYKIVLAPSGSDDPPTSPIWTADDFYISPVAAKFNSGLGSPNGVVAGTAGSASVDADAYWDVTNSILYICTTTGTASTAVWTAINASSAAAIIPSPQGRLTLTSGSPVTTSDVTSATAVYYAPYIGATVPLYNGASFTPTTFAELSLSLVASHAANSNYDVFAFNNSGVVVPVTGPAWTSDTGRGSGVGTTELTRITGILVNNVAITGRNGSTTYSIGANLATYLGTIRTTASTGTTEDSAAKRFAWNCYNRRARPMLVVEATASWVYSTATWRQANGSTANQLAFVVGLSEDRIWGLAQGQFSNGTAARVAAAVGIGLDSTTANSAGLTRDANGTSAESGAPDAYIMGFQGLGYHRLVWLEMGAGSDTQTWTGTESGASPGLQDKMGIIGEVQG